MPALNESIREQNRVGALAAQKAAAEARGL